MADAVSSRYIYPPNWDGYYPERSKPPRRYTISCKCLSDGTGETDAIKLSIGDFLTESRATATKFVVEEIDCNQYGFSSIVLEFDRSPDKPIASFGDSGNMKFPGGLTDNETGGTGNITLTTGGATSGDSYDVKITFRVK